MKQAPSHLFHAVNVPLDATSARALTDPSWGRLKNGSVSQLTTETGRSGNGPLTSFRIKLRTIDTVVAGEPSRFCSATD